MKITSKILSIPPYVSTSWKNVATLHVHEISGAFLLTITMQNRMIIKVPNLDRSTIDTVFEAHARYIEEEQAPKGLPQFGMSLPIKSETALAESLAMTMQHNPQQAHLPNLPHDFLDKIKMIMRVFGAEHLDSLPKAEPHCNCHYCQIARSLHGEPPKPPEEEVVTEQDLQFRTWDIKQTAEQLYLVSNPLDAKEHYSVFLGDPIGCTCGKNNCEHIRAVLNT